MSKKRSGHGLAIGRTLAARLAEWRLALRFEDLSGDVVSKVEDCIIDAVACAAADPTLSADIDPTSRSRSPGPWSPA